MRKDFNILITGASRGIGHAIAKRIAKYAKNLYLTSRTEASLNNSIADISKECEGTIYQFAMDQAKGENAAKELSEWVNSITDRIDILILCAGNYFEGNLCDISSREFDNSLNTNFIFNYYAAKAIVPMMKDSQFARIVIIGSTAAYSAYSVPSYGVAKWALRGLAVNLRQELSPDNIGVTFVSPGPVLTDMWADVDVPSGRILEPDDIAKVVCTIMELSPQAVMDEVIVRPMLGDYDG